MPANFFKHPLKIQKSRLVLFFTYINFKRLRLLPSLPLKNGLQNVLKEPENILTLKNILRVCLHVAGKQSMRFSPLGVQTSTVSTPDTAGVTATNQIISQSLNYNPRKKCLKKVKFDNVVFAKKKNCADYSFYSEKAC